MAMVDLVYQHDVAPTLIEASNAFENPSLEIQAL